MDFISYIFRLPSFADVVSFTCHFDLILKRVLILDDFYLFKISKLHFERFLKGAVFPDNVIFLESNLKHFHVALVCLLTGMIYFKYCHDIVGKVH